MKIIALIILMVLCLSVFGFVGEARAEGTTDKFLNKYDKYKANGDEQNAIALEMYVCGIGNGIACASSAWEIKTFCLPPKLAITCSQTLAILREYIKENPSDKETPLGLVMLRAFEYTLPCNSQEAK